MKKTPLYEEHIRSGAKITEFGGYLLPVSYTSVIKEHLAVRKHCGIFDVSHMGELLVSGHGSLGLLQRVSTNDISRLVPGQAIYTPLCYENGGTVDDILVYMLSENGYLCVVNASNRKKDREWFNENNEGNSSISDISDAYSQIALQGPESEALMNDAFNGLSLPGFFRFTEYDGMIISRTGYTGEDGFEIYAKNEKAAFLWALFLDKGAKYHITPAGLGARDTLRFEACLPLYGHELSPSVSPIEAGLAMFVKFDKKQDFVGKEALLDIRASQNRRRLTGLRMVGKGVPRHGYAVTAGGPENGYVTSGSFCPTLGGSYAIALIDPSSAEGEAFQVLIRGNPVMAEKTPMPFYKKRYKKEAQK